MNNTNTIIVNSFNTRGLISSEKRKKVFKWLNTSHLGKAFLQETHSTLIDEQKWSREWGGDIYFAHWDKFKYKNGCKDENERFILINCEIQRIEFTLINIYYPTKENQTLQIEFLEMITNKLDEHDDKNIILGEDLNTYLTVNLDRKSRIL